MIYGIRDRADFVKRLAQKYSDKQNRYDIEDLEHWLKAKDIPDAKLDDLYDAIAKSWTYRTFPSIAKVNSVWEESFASTRPDSSSESDTMQAIKKLETERNFHKCLNIDNAMNKMRAIREKAMNERLSLADIEFLHTYDPLLAEYNAALKHYGNDEAKAKDHAAKVFEALAEGKSHHSMFRPGASKPMNRANATVPLSKVLG